MKFRHGWAFPDDDELMAGHLRPDGTYQGGHLEAALALVQDFSIAIDGGAHVGTWARPLAARFGRVIACEPSADTFEALEHNLKAFGCVNVEARRCALGAAAGRVAMAPLDARAAALRNTGARFVGPGDDVALEPIDAWQLPALGFLKLDVEGSESQALEGARATLARCRPIVLYENKGLCRRFGLAPDAPARVLTAAGYRELAIVGCDRIWGPR